MRPMGGIALERLHLADRVGEPHPQRHRPLCRDHLDMMIPPRQPQDRATPLAGQALGQSRLRLAISVHRRLDPHRAPEPQHDKNNRQNRTGDRHARRQDQRLGTRHDRHKSQNDEGDHRHGRPHVNHVTNPRRPTRHEGFKRDPRSAPHDDRKPHEKRPAQRPLWQRHHLIGAVGPGQRRDRPDHPPHEQTDRGENP